MIEFTQDGPFAEKADPLFPGRVRIVGLGQTGVAVCDQLVLHGRGVQDLWVLDTDQSTIESSVVGVRHQLGHELVYGLGCSGDLDLAREIIAQSEEQLAPVALGCDFLILCLGLAGATGVAAAERLIELGRGNGAKVIVVGVHPFGCEGLGRRNKAIRAIESLRREADSVLVLSNDRLSGHPTTKKNIRLGFHLMNELLAKTAQALAQIVCKRGLIQLSFADVRSLYGRYAGSEALENCWVAHVDGSTRDCVEDLIEDLLEGPLLADESIWKYIDHAIVAVGGSRDLGLSEVQEMVSALKDRLPVNIPIATSASLDEESNQHVRMSVLFAMTAPVVVASGDPSTGTQPKPLRAAQETAPLPMPKLEPKVEDQPVASAPVTAAKPKPVRASKPKVAPAPLPEPEPVMPVAEQEEELVINDTVPMPPAPKPLAGKIRDGRFIARQEEMEFEAPTRGRFEKTHETIYRGENLDQPTYRRRGLKIKL